MLIQIQFLYGNSLVRMAFEEALRELQEERKINERLQDQIRIYELEKIDKKDYKSLLDSTIKTDKKKIDNLENIIINKDTEYENLQNNFEVLQTTIENIKELCKNKKGKVISVNKILEELGE